MQNLLTQKAVKISIPKAQFSRLALPAFVIILVASPVSRELTLSVLSDAFLQVSIFVAATLSLYYFIAEGVKRERLHRLMGSTSVSSVAACASLGALPGCGGAIVVITQYTKGNVSFGGVVAVLTATMGDAAFLLLAMQPIDGILMIFLGLITGTFTGYLINKIHRYDFMRPSPRVNLEEDIIVLTRHPMKKYLVGLSIWFWRLGLIPVLAIALMIAFQQDPNQVLHLPDGTIETFGALSGFLMISLWALNSKGGSYKQVTSEDPPVKPAYWFTKVALDTQFVTSWVVGAFLIFELFTLFSGVNLTQWLANWDTGIVFLAVTIGLLPGCGPQILVTSLYIQGIIPLSAQLANALSNDGDALFPAIAMAPRAAIVASLYSALPALILGYSYYFLVEG